MSEANIHAMQDRAMEIAEQYNQQNKSEGRAPWTATDYMSGFVGDVGDLSKLIMAHEGKRSIEDVRAKLRHEIGDNFWSLLVLCHVLDVDPAEAFDGTMTELEARFAPRDGA